MDKRLEFSIIDTKSEIFIIGQSTLKPFNSCISLRGPLEEHHLLINTEKNVSEPDPKNDVKIKIYSTREKEGWSNWTDNLENFKEMCV